MSTYVWLLGAMLTAQVPPPPAAGSAVNELRLAERAIRDDEAKRLTPLADRVGREGHPAVAKAIRRWIEEEPREPGASRFVPLPKVVPRSTPGLANIPATAATAAQPALGEARKIREGTAKALFSLAELAAKAKRFALADECLRAVLERQPDHREARRLLGYVPYAGGWATAYAKERLTQKWVDHPVFGWVDALWVSHLDQGELPAPKSRRGEAIQWLPAAQADELHRSWESRWRIDTEHFRIETNVPHAEAIVFGRQLEAFYELFFALLADLFTAENLPLARRFESKAAAKEIIPKPHLVYYFASKAEYVDHLAPSGQGNSIEKTLGIYVPPEAGRGRRAPAYFFRDPDGQVDASATLYHEVSHQLLFETSNSSAYLKNRGNYWVFEGLGTYFESVVPEPGGALLVGGLVGPRIEEARRRVLDEQEFVPIDVLVQLGENAFKREAVVHLHYAEAMALTVFLMQARNEGYREAFLDYVRDAYRGRLKMPATGRSLEDRLGVPYATLNEEFLAYLKRR